MTFEGAQVQGAQKIVEKFMSLTFKEVKHDVQTIDCQPSLTGGVLVMVSGQLKVFFLQVYFIFSCFHRLITMHLTVFRKCSIW